MKYSIILFTIIFYNCASTIKKEPTVILGNEQYRPQYHFTPPANWMNDPNGMVYHEGEYHLFYQHFPDSNVWGPMHWGHAVSTDLIHWEHLPIALYPDSLGYIFSGSCVIDYENTSGFGNNGEPPMVAIFTHAFLDEQRIPQRQSIAYSLDKGKTWTKYEGNPVIDEGLVAFRDPKVFWHDDSDSWIMSIAATTDNAGMRPDHIRFYASPDLKSWKYLSEFGHNIGSQDGKWECPDLFKMKVEGNKEEKWVLLVSINPGGPQGGSATQYFVGNFDGEKFIPEDSVTRWLDYGADNYAGVTWSNVPPVDGRRLFIGWMSNWQYAQVVPTTEWRSAMTLPRELRLEGMSLKSVPVKELISLRKETIQFDRQKEEWQLPGSLLELELEVNAIGGEKFQVVFSNDQGEEVVIGLTSGELTVDRTQAGVDDFNGGFAKVHSAPLVSAPEQVKIYLDLSSVEIFVNDGTTVMTELVFPNEPYDKLEIKGNKSMVSSIKGHVLTSIWRKGSQQETQAGL